MVTVFVVVGFGLLSCSGRGCCFCQVRGAEIASLKSTRSDVARRPSPKGSVGGNLGGQKETTRWHDDDVVVKRFAQINQHNIIITMKSRKCNNYRIEGTTTKYDTSRLPSISSLPSMAIDPTGKWISASRNMIEWRVKCHILITIQLIKLSHDKFTGECLNVKARSGSFPIEVYKSTVNQL